MRNVWSARSLEAPRPPSLPKAAILATPLFVAGQGDIQSPGSLTGASVCLALHVVVCDAEVEAVPRRQSRLVVGVVGGESEMIPVQFGVTDMRRILFLDRARSS